MARNNEIVPTAIESSADVGEAAAKVLREIAAVAGGGEAAARLFFPEGIDYISMNVTAAGVSLGFVVAGPKSKPGSQDAGIQSLAFAETNFVLLPQDSSAFKRYSPAANQWGTPDAIPVPAGAAATLHATDPSLFFSVGDISLKGGGPMPGHTTGHQQGRNIDVRPIRTDRTDAPVDFTMAAYDQAATQKVIDAFLAQPNVSFIIFNDPGITGVRSDPSGTHVHDNHFHVQTTT